MYYSNSKLKMDVLGCTGNASNMAASMDSRRAASPEKPNNAIPTQRTDVPL